MQVAVALPGMEEMDAEGGIGNTLLRKVCGTPLFARVVATACRSGGTEVILLLPKTVPEASLKACLERVLPSFITVKTVALDPSFDSDDPSHWRAIESQLDSKFLWLPWNTVVDKKTLTRLVVAGEASAEGVHLESAAGCSQEGQHGTAPLSRSALLDLPVVVVKGKLTLAEDPAENNRSGGPLRGYLADPSVEVISVPESPGVTVCSVETARLVERELVRRSGKDSDGIYSKWNRWLCRPAVRWLSKTPVTPNAVTFGGLAVAALSAYWFAQGDWSAYVLGALLFFVSVLFDEMDGMLARITFRDSAFGTWLESFVDYAGYLLLFLGMTIGLYRESGVLWLWMGGFLLFGTLTSLLILSHQRKLVTNPEAPHEYRQRLHRRLEADSANVVSRLGRQLEFLTRKPAYCYSVVIFTLLGGTKLLFLLTALGANVVWIMALSFNRLFRFPASEGQPLKVGGDL